LIEFCNNIRQLSCPFRIADTDNDPFFTAPGAMHRIDVWRRTCGNKALEEANQSANDERQPSPISKRQVGCDVAAPARASFDSVSGRLRNASIAEETEDTTG
jgi:hypothetical protein